MSCLCAGRTSKKKNSPIIKLRELSYPIQIGNDKKKWKSSELAENDHVSLVEDDSNKQFWQLQRAEEYPLWTFHVKPEGGKELYVTYNDGDQKDQKVRMQSATSKDSSKEKYFEASVTSSGKIALSSRSSKERFLGIKDGILAMIDEKWSESNIEWILAVDLNRLSNEHICKIEDYNKSTQMWVSENAGCSGPINVGGSGTRTWRVNKSTNSSGHTIRINSASAYYVCQSKDCNKKILLNAETSNHLLTRYDQITKRGVTHTYRLQNAHTKWFVGTISQGKCVTLQMNKKAKSTPYWQFIMAHSIFIEEDGTTVTFPPLPEK